MALSLGGTIGEIQSKMSLLEFQTWCDYRAKYGPLNPVRMYDQSGAIVASQINNAYGGKGRPKDFILYGKEEQNEEDDIINQLVSIGRAKVAR